MRKLTSYLTKVPLVEAIMTVFMVFAVFTAYNIFTYDAPLPPVQASVEVASIVEVPEVIEMPAVPEVPLVIDVPVALELPIIINEVPAVIDVPAALALPIVINKRTAVPETIAVPVIEAVEIAEEPMVETKGLGYPVRINIPSIAVDAAVKVMGETAAGAMAVPSNAVDTGWYVLGPFPGDIGSAVIGGHVAWPYGSAGVFTNLHKLAPGDTIMVQNDSGVVSTFVVRETKMYDAADDATDVFSSDDGGAHLNIITCAGVWDTKANQYTQRLVVFTDKHM